MKGPAECIDRFKGKLKSLKLIATGTRLVFECIYSYTYTCLSPSHDIHAVGEPLNKDARDWFLDKVGQGDCPLIDTWWQTGVFSSYT